MRNTAALRASLALCAAIAGVSAAAAREPLRFVGAAPVGDVSIPVRTMQDLKFAGVVKQQYDFSCGSAALATLLRLYGDRYGEVSAFRGMWAGGDHAQIRKLGFSLLDMKRYLAGTGRTANGYKVSLARIEAAGIPGIALITVRGYRHFVVVQGVRSGEVLVADPALGLRVESTKVFEKSWNGIFFVIDTDVAGGKATFNDPHRWAAYGRAPVGSRFTDPLSLQALMLTAPSYRDF